MNGPGFEKPKWPYGAKMALLKLLCMSHIEECEREIMYLLN